MKLIKIIVITLVTCLTVLASDLLYPYKITTNSDGISGIWFDWQTANKVAYVLKDYQDVTNQIHIQSNYIDICDRIILDQKDIQNEQYKKIIKLRQKSWLFYGLGVVTPIMIYYIVGTQ